jgi:hypothetical protein
MGAADVIRAKANNNENKNLRIVCFLLVSCRTLEDQMNVAGKTMPIHFGWLPRGAE